MASTDLSQPIPATAIGAQSSPPVPAERSGLDAQTRKALTYDANKKSALVAYILLFFLGYFGAHRFYLGKTGTAATILILSMIGFALSFFFVGLFVLLIPAIWVIVDLFLVPGMVKQFNNNLIQSIS